MTTMPEGAVSHVDLIESSDADTPPVGVTRILRVGGSLFSRFDGAARTALGGGASSGPLTLVYASGALGAPTTTHSTGAVLNGDADERWRIELDLVGGSGTNGTIEIQPNGSTTTVFYTAWGIDSTNGGTISAIASEGSTTKAVIGYLGGGAAQDRTLIIVDAWVKSGGGRIFSFASEMNRITATTLQRVTRGHAEWQDTAANITSLSFVAQQANGIGAGSFINIWKQSRT